MTRTALSIRPAPDSGLVAVDVTVEALEHATVADLAGALGAHLAPERRGLMVVPTEAGAPLPADRLVSECGLRTGDLVDVVTVPDSWLDHGGPQPAVRARIRVVSGPDAGRHLAVRGAEARIGRGAGCALRLSDPLVSQRHLRISFAGRPTLTDEGSANGTYLDGRPLDRAATPADWGAPITIGATTLVLEPGSLVDAPPPVSVLRSPRFGDLLEQGEAEIKSPPAKPHPSPVPWTMIALPLMMGVALYATTRSPYTLIYVFGWPVVGLGGWWMQRRSVQREFEREVRYWRQDADEVLQHLDEQRELQRARAEEDHPDELAPRIAERGLWTLQQDSPGFLHARIGRGSVPAALLGKLADGGDRELVRDMRGELKARAFLEHLPVVADLAHEPVTAITGDPTRVDEAARALLVRLACDHSPTDLTVAAVLDHGRLHLESWLRWLPHAAQRIGGAPPVAVGAKVGQGLLERLASEDGGHGHTLCIVDESAGVSRRTIESVAAAAAERRLHLLWLGSSPQTVPAATGTLIDTAAHHVGRRDRGGLTRLDAVDAVPLARAWRLARSMTAYVDEAAVLPADTSLPTVVRLPELSADLADLDDVTAVRRRWATSRGLRAQVGEGVDGVVTLDLREDGPHGLVAGTTGSGKSEFLQSLICSLALNNPVDRINFLLVDYKGGAAFREAADLPHTVGYITDLTPALVQRALTSLGAEITRREEMLATFGVKDLAMLERQHPEAAPPSLLICVDEFAALTAEVPDFVDGMVNLAQRGRSLGMHLLLATQRPAGVITAAIRANTDLRISLRVGSVDDSNDVIDTPEAARISRRTPGRAWVRRTGHGTAELVQSAWVGARETLAGHARAVTVQPYTIAPNPALDAEAGDAGRLDPRTDLERCVATIRAAFDASGAALPARPWLPSLPAELPLDADQLTTAATDPVGGLVAGQVVLGRVDEPALQRQPALVLDYPAVGHLLVHGASGSGKTELLRTVAIAASVLDTATGAAPGLPAVAPYVYAIDYAGGGLAAVSGLPTVASVVTDQDPARVLRLVRLLRHTVTERSRAMAQTGSADLADLARAGHPLPRVHLLIDNLPALLEQLEGGGGVSREHVEMLGTVLQNGRRVGVHVTATAPGRTGVPTALASSFGRRLVLRMTSADDYMMLGVPAGVLGPDTPPGEGLLGRSSVQVATLGGAGTPVQAERVDEVAMRLAPVVAGRPRAGVPAMPPRLPSEALPAPSVADLAVGVEADQVSVVTADLLTAPLLVTGPARSGRTSLLRGLADLAARSAVPPVEVVHAGPDGADLTALAERVEAFRPSGDEWLLVLVDDADVWEERAPVDAAVREALARVVAALAGTRRVGLVVASDARTARSRSSAGGLVTRARSGGCGVLLQPDWADGDLLGVAVPNKTVEPLSGPGRGLWCSAGQAKVLQATCQTEIPGNARVGELGPEGDQ